MSRWVRLKHQDGVFRDPQTGFTVTLDEVVELTEPIGELTRRWLVAGGLVDVDSPENVGAGPGSSPGLPSDAPPLDPPVDEGTDAGEVQPADDAEEPPIAPAVLKRKPRKRK